MWRASSGWMERAIDAGILKGSGMALLAYTVLHSHEALSFLRCRLVCREQGADHGNQQPAVAGRRSGDAEDGGYNGPRKDQTDIHR
jgi:hypothetical protein